MSNETSALRVVEEKTGGDAGAAIPRINLEAPLSGSVVVSGSNGEMFCINADHGTVTRLRWA